MTKQKARWERLWDAMEKVAARAEWTKRAEADPASAWLEVARFCAEDSFKNNFPSRRGTFVINDVPTESGQVVCFYNNNPYTQPGYGNAIDHGRRDRETDRFRQRMKAAGITELAYASYPPAGSESAGYTYAMIFDAAESQLGVIHDAMKAAMREANETGPDTDEADDSGGELETVSDPIAGALTVNVGSSAQLRHVRTGQDLFSRAVRDNYGHLCCFPGCQVDHDALLVGAHIARWADDPESRGDVSNGLCLCALHDRAFEAGFFTLTDDFRVHFDARKTGTSAWAANFQVAEGQPIKLGTIRPSVNAIQQHRERHK